MATTTYLYCSDESYSSRPVRVRELTPRCTFGATSRAEARQVLAALEAALEPDGRRFGAAGIRQETARERRRILSPSETLPDLYDYMTDRGVFAAYQRALEA